MAEAICIQAVGSNTCVTIETLKVPQIDAIPREDITIQSPAKSMLQQANTLRKAFTCRNVSVAQEEDLELDMTPPLRACLVSRTRRPNEPLIRVRQGTIKLTNINILHNANGVDIWNGNAAIQIQSPIGPDDYSLVSASRAILDGVNVCSKSDRDIVTIDGGATEIYSSYVHDCAATDIYVGGTGSAHR